MKQKNTILSIGTVYLDIIGMDFPGENGVFPNREAVGDSYTMQLGGSALNFAQTTARLGLNTIFIGKVGNDIPGEIVTNLSKKAGIKPSLIQSSKVQTNLGINLNTKSGTIMLVVGNANQSLTKEEVYNKAITELPNTSFLYIGGILKNTKLIPAYIRLSKKAKKQNIKIVLDHGRVTNKTTTEEIHLLTQKILPLVDIYLPSEDEFLHIMQTETIDDAIAKLKTITKATTILKMAEKGSIVFSRDMPKKTHKAFKVEVKNSVGAGDTFNAGFIAEYSKTNSIDKAITFASATAAIKISTNKLPTRETVTDFINSCSYIQKQ